MPKINYLPDKKLHRETLDVIEQANVILEDYDTQGYDLTLRQLFYQFVSRNMISNTQKEYKRLGSIVNQGRLAGLIDWYHITDRTRNLQSNARWNSPAESMAAEVDYYNIDMWKNQSTRVECWIEKDALIGVIAPVCKSLDVPYFSCRGYTSQSEMWRAGQRMQYEVGKDSHIVLHLGDHDPSGIDMTRDIEDRLKQLACNEHIDVRRIALNMDQVEQYDPPPNPAKLTDSRAADYIREFGENSWELDALEPSVLSDLIINQILDIRDEALWKKSKARLKREKKQIKLVADNWKGVLKFLRNRK